MPQWIVDNWFVISLAVLVGVEKIIRLSPTKKDDIILDMIILPIVNKLKGEKK